MPLATLDARAALVIIDLQKGLLGVPLLTPMADIVARVAALADAFRAHGLTVVLVNAASRPPGRADLPRRPLARTRDFTEIVPELLAHAHERDLHLTKAAPGAFGDSTLAADLRSRGVTQVVVVGVSTSQGVEATARQAFDLGFNVAVPLDAVTDADPLVHENSTTRIFPRIAETGTTADVLALLAIRGTLS